jgi:hypothetical protein
MGFLLDPKWDHSRLNWIIGSNTGFDGKTTFCDNFAAVHSGVVLKSLNSGYSTLSTIMSAKFSKKKNKIKYILIDLSNSAREQKIWEVIEAILYSDPAFFKCEDTLFNYRLIIFSNWDPMKNHGLEYISKPRWKIGRLANNTHTDGNSDKIIEWSVNPFFNESEVNIKGRFVFY